MSAQHIGVDYSTRKLAVVRLHDTLPAKAFSIEFPARKYPNRIDAMLEIHYEFTGFLLDIQNPPKFFIAIESPIMGMHRDVQTAVWMGMTAGCLMVAASDYGHRPVLVPPATWKKRVCGRGNMNKAEVAEYIGSRYPVLDSMCSNDDERDALCLALYAETIDMERGDDEQEAEKATGSQ